MTTLQQRWSTDEFAIAPVQDPNVIDPKDYNHDDAILLIMDAFGMDEGEAELYYLIITGVVTGDVIDSDEQSDDD